MQNLTQNERREAVPRVNRGAPAATVEVEERGARRAALIAAALAAAALAATVLLAPTVGAQSGDTARTVTVPPEGSAPEIDAATRSAMSAEVAAARAAQDAFERNRRAGLRFYNGGADATCEVQIGDLCYWNNNGDVPPPAERTDLIIERDRLLAMLGEAAKASPADDWIAGMRVRYALEQKQNSLALEAARDCQASAWWCKSLEGLALHVDNKHEAATAAFAAALAAMSDSTRCVWTDLSPWLETNMHEAYRASGCAARGPTNARVLRLAQPLWMLPSNDLQNELYARHTISVIQRQGRIPYDGVAGFDASIYPLQLRYGWPTAWSMQNAGVLDPRLPSIIGHEPTPSYDFMPTPAALGTPLSASVNDWEPDRKEARMRYATRYASGFGLVPHQLARFRRGDSTVLAGAWRLQRELRMGPAPYQAGLILADDQANIVSRQVKEDAGANGALITPMGSTARVVSLEVFAPTNARAARVRTAVQPLPTSARMSDLLLLTQGDATGAPSLEALAPFAYGGSEIEAGRSFGLYWESYIPTTPASPVQVTIRATRVEGSFLQRMSSALRLSKAMTPISIRFADVGRSDGEPGRSLQLTWPEVPAGDYRLTVLLNTASASDSTVQLVTVRER